MDFSSYHRRSLGKLESRFEEGSYSLENGILTDEWKVLRMQGRLKLCKQEELVRKSGGEELV